jgi:hypothetical protein
MEHRNPYLILGLPYGASRDAATVAFARRSKALRRGGGARGDLTDLTWALQQIEAAPADPSAVVDVYRLPADPAVFAAPGPGALAPPPLPLAPITGDREAALADLARGSRLDLLRYLVLVHAGRVETPAW